jgi:para-aminobenzoate synthetase component 1
MGYFGYNLGRRYVSKKTVPHTKTARFADMQMGIYHWAIVQDHLYKKAWVVSLPECAPQVLTEIHKRILDTTLPTEPIEPLLVHNLHATITRDQYLKQFERIYDYLLAGDCYQVNFAQRFCADYSGDPYSAYQKLRTLMASPFSAYLKLGKQAIMSLSPERFLRVQGRKVITQPIKGTSPRQTDPLQDKQQAISLQKSEKNQAENVMIVDLLRNDLGQHCIPGSIRVDTLFGLQSFPNVHHLVSDISGTLQNNSHSLDLLRSCFPGGSITGAPKRRAMEIIDELESDNRGVYCGSIGYISNSGNIDTNIAIRTVSCDGEQLHCWGGGGIVIDSEAKAEYDESLNKINTILQALKDSTTD